MTYFTQYGGKVLVNACAGSKYSSNRDKNKWQRMIYLCSNKFEALIGAFVDLAEGKINLTKEVSSCLMSPTSRT